MTGENPLQRYWDKALLLILVLLAGYIAMTRVLSSPIQSQDSTGTPIGPKELVEAIDQNTDRLKSVLQRQTTFKPETPEYFEAVETFLTPSEDMTPSNPLTDRLPGQEGGAAESKIPTPIVLAPENVQVRSSIGLLKTSGSEASNTLSSAAKMRWVTVAAEFPFYEQYLVFAGIKPQVDQQQRLPKDDQYFRFARLELERQQMQPDGSWGPAEHIDNPYKTYSRQLPETVKALGELYTHPRREDDLSNRDIFENWLSRDGFQEFIIRPQFLRLDGFEQWIWPDEPPESDDKQSTWLALAGQTPRDSAPNYKLLVDSESSDREDRRDARARAPLTQDPLFPGAPMNIGMIPGGGGLDPVQPRTTNTRDSRQSTARQSLPRTYRPEDAPKSVPIWVHDSTVTPGETYRYRIRAILYNPLCGSRQATSTAVRSTGWLTGKWSGWSQPVQAAQDHYFFFTGVSRIGSKPPRAKLQVYAWDKGYWYDYPFYYADVDQIIGGPKEVPDPSVSLASIDSRTDRANRNIGNRDRTAPLPPPHRPKIQIDFTTDWTIVEFNADVEQERPVKDQPDQLQTVIVHELVAKNNTTGLIVTRYSDLDKNDTQKVFLDEIIRRQKQAIEQPPSRRSSDRRTPTRTDPRRPMPGIDLMRP